MRRTTWSWTYHDRNRKPKEEKQSKKLIYLESRQQEVDIHWHQAQSEADGDVYHRFHDIDLCTRQFLVRWLFLTSDLSMTLWPGRHIPLLISLTVVIDWANIHLFNGRQACSSHRFTARCRISLRTSSCCLWLTAHDTQNLPVGDGAGY